MMKTLRVFCRNVNSNCCYTRNFFSDFVFGGTQKPLGVRRKANQHFRKGEKSDIFGTRFDSIKNSTDSAT